MKCTPNTRRLIHSLLLALLVAVGCARAPQATPAPALAATPAAALQTGGTIAALGTVRPAQTLQLSIATGGPIKALTARVGRQVEKGELLAEVDTGALLLDIENAEQEVVYWQATLDSLLGGPSEAQVARVEADQAHRVAQAEIALQVARQTLAAAQCQDPVPDVAAAQAGVAQVERQLAQAGAGVPEAEVTLAQVDLARAQDALDAARDEYRKALDRPWEPQEMRDALAQAVQRAEWGLESAEARLKAAQRALRTHALGLDVLAAQGEAAKAQVARALGAQAAYSETLASLAADVTLAERQLEELRSWTNPLLDPPSEGEVAQVRARLRQAEIALEALRWRLARAALRAPFDGVIADVLLRPGEWAASGVPVLEIVDTSQWIVETRNVSELAIGQVHVGQEAIVEILALDRAEVHGVVDAISPVAVVQQGDTTYTLYIALEAADLNLRPGMNAEVRIQAPPG